MFSSFSKSAKTHQFRYHRKNTRDPATRYRSIVAESLQANMLETLVEVAHHLERLDFAWLWCDRDELRRVDTSPKYVELEDIIFRVHGEEGPTVDTTVSGHAENLNLEYESSANLHRDLSRKLKVVQVEVRIDWIPDLLGKTRIARDTQPTRRDALDPRQGRGEGLIARRRRVHLLGAGGLDGHGGLGVAGGKGQGEGGGHGETHRGLLGDAVSRRT